MSWSFLFTLVCVTSIVVTHSQPSTGVFDFLYNVFGGASQKIDATASAAVTAGRPGGTPKPPQALQVIGAGLPRTGTGSLYTALGILGYESYHMIKVTQNAQHTALWAAVARQEVTLDTVWETLATEGYNATLDWPMSDYFAQALQKYPTAKVILTVRDNATVWAQSFQTLVRMVKSVDCPFSWTYPNPFYLFTPVWIKNLRQVHCAVGRNVLGWEACQGVQVDSTLSIEWLEMQYQKQWDAVQAAVPPEQLLIYNVKEGWQPLCEFLQVPVPPHPFPHVGKTRMIHRVGSFFMAVTYAWIPVLAFLAAGALGMVSSSHWGKRGCQPKKKVD